MEDKIEVSESDSINYDAHETHDCVLTKKSKRCAYCNGGFQEFSKKLMQLLSNENPDIKGSIELVKDYYEKSFDFLEGSFIRSIKHTIQI